jgi:hypothetical protein
VKSYRVTPTSTGRERKSITLAATDYEVAIGQCQLLNQNSANATNEPLKPNASTLSRTDRPNHLQ